MESHYFVAYLLALTYAFKNKGVIAEDELLPRTGNAVQENVSRVQILPKFISAEYVFFTKKVGTHPALRVAFSSGG